MYQYQAPILDTMVSRRNGKQNKIQERACNLVRVEALIQSQRTIIPIGINVTREICLPP